MRLPAPTIGFALALTACSGGGGDIAPTPPGVPPPPTDTPGSLPAITLTTVASGFVQPLAVVAAFDGSDRLFVAERRGRIRIIEGGTVVGTPFLNIEGRVGSAGSEQGLLGLAFSPDYTNDGFFYVSYTDTGGNAVLSRFSVGGSANQADAASEQMLLTVPQPFANHNNGNLAFGPGGYLYAGYGDGGSAGDPDNNAQNTDTLLGSIIRIDVSTVPYTIPADNPIAPNNEIWAYGLRNPWRFSFDRDSGDLYIGDVGQQSWEEVNFQPGTSVGGENYGWNLMEASGCFAIANCSSAGLELPVFEYHHDDGDCSVTGGYVYRGVAHPALEGVYLFGDFCSGRIRGLRRNAGVGIWELGLLLDTDLAISTFGEDEAGEIYVAGFGDGVIYRVSL